MHDLAERQGQTKDGDGEEPVLSNKIRAKEHSFTSSLHVCKGIRHERPEAPYVCAVPETFIISLVYYFGDSLTVFL